MKARYDIPDPEGPLQLDISDATKYFWIVEGDYVDKQALFPRLFPNAFRMFGGLLIALTLIAIVCMLFLFLKGISLLSSTVAIIIATLIMMGGLQMLFTIYSSLLFRNDIWHSRMKLQGVPPVNAILLALLFFIITEPGSFIGIHFQNVRTDSAMSQWLRWFADQTMAVIFADIPESVFNFRLSEIQQRGAWSKIAVVATRLLIGGGLLQLIILFATLKRKEEFVGTNRDLYDFCSSGREVCRVTRVGEVVSFDDPEQIDLRILGRPISEYMGEIKGVSDGLINCQ